MNRLYAGIDLHSNNSVVVVADEEDRVVYRKRLPNELDAVLGALRPFEKDVAGVVVESTYNWYWLVDGLKEHGYRLHLANTGAIQQYSGLKHGDDDKDARWLAKMLCLGILPEGYICPKQMRGVRDLLRKRGYLIRHRTSNILSIQNLIARNTGRRVSGDGIKKLTDSAVTDMLPNPDHALAAQTSVAAMHCLTTQIKKIEKVVLERVRLRQQFKNLKTVNGIGDILGLTIMLEVGEIGRFATVGNFASYARCVNSTRLSNGKKKGTGNTKNGNRYLGWAFMEAAGFAFRYDETIKRYYQRKLAKAHVMVARKAVAHKLARACYYILRDQTVFDVNKAFG